MEAQQFSFTLPNLLLKDYPLHFGDQQGYSHLIQTATEHKSRPSLKLPYRPCHETQTCVSNSGINTFMWLKDS